MAKQQIRDPNGGLTAYGRKHYKEKFGNKLRPGVKNVSKTKSWGQKVRWAKWATRFYGQQNLPPLVKPNGEPTRLALTAKAWGVAVPKTEDQARRIAARGRRILEQYKNQKSNNGKTKRR